MQHQQGKIMSTTPRLHRVRLRRHIFASTLQQFQIVEDCKFGRVTPQVGAFVERFFHLRNCERLVEHGEGGEHTVRCFPQHLNGVRFIFGDGFLKFSCVDTVGDARKFEKNKRTRFVWYEVDDTFIFVRFQHF